MMQVDNAQHKQQLLSYFDGEGFGRWQQIYGEGPISGVRASVREGHSRVVAMALDWLADGGTRQSRQKDEQEATDAPTVLDAGCGTGLLTLALARRGWQVTAVDLAPQMAAATAAAVQAAGIVERVDCSAGDLDAVKATFDAVACLDVLIHYPAAQFGPMLTRLAARSRGPLVFSYAPREPLLAGLHWVGGLFPKPQRRTTVQMIPRELVAATLAQAGMQIRREQRVSVGFYHVALVEAGRV